MFDYYVNVPDEGDHWEKLCTVDAQMAAEEYVIDHLADLDWPREVTVRVRKGEAGSVDEYKVSVEQEPVASASLSSSDVV